MKYHCWCELPVSLHLYHNQMEDTRIRVAPGIMFQGQVRAVYLKLIHLNRFISNRRSSEVQFAMIDIAVTSGTACLRDQVCQHVLGIWPLKSSPAEKCL